MMQRVRDEGKNNGAIPMQKFLISFVLSILSLGASINVDRPLVLASDGSPQGTGTDKNISSGVASRYPTGDNTRGEELYSASCVVCHGPQARGGIGPRLAGNPVLWSEQAFWKTLSEGQHMMPPLKGALTEQQMADIQAWLKTLR